MTGDPHPLVAALGPTNTGKTHHAIERMLEFGTGMIGLPLRLLAREVYDRITERIGEREVALVTGEERRIPSDPRYWVCTVEAMPVSRRVEFLAVDEVQLCAHHQRGHVFTDRVLHARGAVETMFMGASTMRERLAELCPGIALKHRPRLSQLRWAGRSSMGNLPKRSAVVAFSARQVYEIAEHIRRRHGGAAVVMGALSPRTRNAQVAMYQAGEVDYLVATDAIGMGLNMDVGHVAFAATQKFDGRTLRALRPAELAQIAGRAGRYQTDGTFGVLDPVPEFEPRLVRLLEQHRFEPLRMLRWRNSDLSFDSPTALLNSLRRPPERPGLRRMERAEDADALARLATRQPIVDAASTPRQVELLWEVCQIPDYRQLMVEQHADLLGEIFVRLRADGTLTSDWMRERVERLADIEGPIDALTTRISFIRTWSYLCQKPRWVQEREHWAERTRAIEDALSDALHERLVHRFGRRDGPALVETKADADNPFAVLQGLLDGPGDADAPAPQTGGVESVIDAQHHHLRLDGEGTLHTRGESKVELGRLRRGTERLAPDVTLGIDVAPGVARRLQRRLVAWIRDEVGQTLEPLRTLENSQHSSAARGLAYQLGQSLGTLPIKLVKAQLGELTEGERSAFAEAGIVFGARALYVPSLLRPNPMRLRLALTRIFDDFDAPVPSGAVSIPVDKKFKLEHYMRIGFIRAGPRAIRVDVLERGLAAIGKPLEAGDPLPPKLASWWGSKTKQVPAILKSLGYIR